MGKIVAPEAVKGFAASIERELNLMRRDALEAKLDNPSVWLGLIDPALLLKLSETWRPLETKLREAITSFRQSGAGSVESGAALTKILEEPEASMKPLNAEMIALMAYRLKDASVPRA